MNIGRRLVENFRFFLVVVSLFFLTLPAFSRQQPPPDPQAPPSDPSATQRSQSGDTNIEDDNKEGQEQATGTSNGRLFFALPNFLTLEHAGPAESPDTQSSQERSPPEQAGTSSTGSNTKQSDANSAGQSTAPANQGTPPEKEQPKRILGLMPNFRAVSAGAIPPPPTAKQALVIATQNSFDYSSFIFVGITSLLAEGTDAHSQLGKGVAGYGRYYWRGFVDKTDGNYLAIFALPTVFHQDERYYAMGKGGFWKRAVYSATRVLITPDYHGHNSFNISELLGKGMAQGISLAYYPSGSRSAGALATKYGYAIGRDALTNVFREFWPDIATHVLHRHP